MRRIAAAAPLAVLLSVNWAVFGPGTPDPILDLGPPKKIRSITVYSSPWSRGTVTVTGLEMKRFARRF